MFDQTLQLMLRLFLSGFLVLLILFSLAGVRVLWSSRTIVLDPFQFVSEESESDEKGRHFTLLLLKNIHRLRILYSQQAGEYALIPSGDQIGRAEQLNLLTIKESDLPNVEIEGYGLKLTALLKPIARRLARGEQIEGTVTKSKEKYEVFAELRGGRPGDSKLHWYLADSNSLEKLSFRLAIRLFRFMAAREEKLITEIPDDDFETFTEAVEAYESYRLLRQKEPRAQRLTGSDRSRAHLSEAHRIISDLLERSEGSPLYFKLSAYIYKEMGNLREAESSLNKYAQLLQDRSLAPTARDLGLLKEIRGLASASLGPVSGDHLVQPGISVGPMGREILGTICCLAKDKEDFRYALTSPFLFWFNSGDKGLVGLGAASGSGATRFPIGVVTKATTDPSGGLLIRINDGLAASSEILEYGGFSGFSNDVKVGEQVIMVGARSGKVEGKVLSIKEAEFITTRIADKGDTGAPILNSRRELIGMVWGGDGERTFVTRIAKVLADLDVEIVDSKN